MTNAKPAKPSTKVLTADDRREIRQRVIDRFHDCRKVSNLDVHQHMPRFVSLVSYYEDPVTIVECGVRTGVSTCSFLYGLYRGYNIDYGNPDFTPLETDKPRGKLYSIDVNPAEVPDEWHDLPEWNFFRGDDLAWLENKAPESVDIAFIDTSHYYRHTLAEITAFWKIMSPGGVILCHDTEVELVGTDPHQVHWPVRQALDDFCARTEDDDPIYRGLDWQNVTGSHGLGILYKPMNPRS